MTVGLLIVIQQTNSGEPFDWGESRMKPERRISPGISTAVPRCPRCGRKMRVRPVITGSDRFVATGFECSRCGDLAYSGERLATPPPVGKFVFFLVATLVLAGIVLFLATLTTTKSPPPVAIDDNPAPAPVVVPKPLPVAPSPARPVEVTPLPQAPAPMPVAPVYGRPVPPPRVETNPLPTPTPAPLPTETPEDKAAKVEDAIKASLQDLQDAREELKKKQAAREAARKTLLASSEYVGAVKVEQGLKEQVEKLRREESPSPELSLQWIAAKGEVARLENANEAVGEASAAVSSAQAYVMVVQQRIAELRTPPKAPVSIDVKTAIAARELAVGMTYPEACRSARAQGIVFRSQGSTTVYRWPIKSRVGSHTVITATHFSPNAGTYRNETEEVADYRVTSFVEAIFTDGKIVSFQRIAANGQ
jgi:hypothetical protein